MLAMTGTNAIWKNCGKNVIKQFNSAIANSPVRIILKSVCALNFVNIKSNNGFNHITFQLSLVAP